MITRHPHLFAALTILAVVLAACSTAGPAPNALTITVTDAFNFDPPTLQVKAGQEYSLTFSNKASVEHTFNILKLEAELEHVLEETDEEHLHEEMLFEMHGVPSGGSETEKITTPVEPGDYVIVCLVPGHADAGLVGTLTVTR